MGEGAGSKNQGDKKSDKNDDGTVVLKLDMFCEGCLKKVVQDIDGVKVVEVDLANSMLMVVGKIDPAKIRDQVAEKTKKKVDIIFPQPKKDGGDKKKADENKKQPADQDKKNTDENKKQPADQDKKKAYENKKQTDQDKKKADENKKQTYQDKKKADENKKQPADQDKKKANENKKQPTDQDKKKTDENKQQPADQDKKKPEEPMERTVLYETGMHCDRFVHKLMDVASEFAGVRKVKALVSVKGTMDVKALTPFLSKKLSRDVKVVVPADNAASGGEKKAKEGGGGNKK